jgi:hypothetical protein
MDAATQECEVVSDGLPAPWLDPLYSHSRSVASPADWRTLPYHNLGPRGLERLCFDLLVQSGARPRVFGKPGQPQYGIDLLVEAADKRTVYQCKNLDHSPSVEEIREALGKFSTDWLHVHSLPAPAEFVFCCPQPFDDTNLNTRFILAQQEFKQATGIDVVVWHREYFDSRLRLLPDLVSSLFSSDLAVQFCGVEDWRYDLFTEVRLNQVPRHRLVKRFLELRESIFVSDETEEQFREAFLLSRTILVRGLPASGKTITSLEMATRIEDNVTGLHHRIYFAQVGDVSVENLVRAIQRRRSLPSIFILDDCHVGFDVVATTVERLMPELTQPNARVALILISRYLPAQDDSYVHSQDLINSLSTTGAVITLSNDLTRFQSVLEYVRPDLMHLSQVRLCRLYGFCAGDLLLLHTVLEFLQEAPEIDGLDLGRLLAHVRSEYFKKNAVYYPTITSLAGLAQFGLTPDVRLPINWSDDERRSADSLISLAGQPPCYHFLHSSLAELLFRALLDAEGVKGEAAILQRISELLKAHFLGLVDLIRRGRLAVSALVVAFERVEASSLRLLSSEATSRLKAEFLFDDDGVLKHYSSALGLHLLTRCVQLGNIQPLAPPQWVVDALIGELEHSFSRPYDPSLPSGLALAIRELRSAAPDRVSGLEQKLGAARVVGFIRANGTLSDLFWMLRSTTTPFARSLLTILLDGGFDELLCSAIKAKSSIASLHMPLMELRRVDEAILQSLEQGLGTSRLLTLIRANGTLYELFRMLESTTTGFARSLLALVDEDCVEELCQKTINSGRSIGTLNMPLRSLRKADEAMHESLEQRIGPSRLLTLIRANGTLYELFRMLESTTTGFARSLLALVDEDCVEELCQKTIDSGRSIATFPMALRLLGKADETMRGALEQKIGPSRFLALIRTNGTLYELFMTLQATTLGFSQAIVMILNEEAVEALFRRTVNSGRSIGMMGFALAALRKADETLLKSLELKIGAGRMLRLIKANGTLIDLLKMLQSTTTAFAQTLVMMLDEDVVEELFQRTVRLGRSIGTVNLAFQQLRATDEALLQSVEQQVGAERLLRLIRANGTVFELFRIIDCTSLVFARELVAILDEDSVEELCQKTIHSGRSIGVLNWSLQKLRTADEVLLRSFEQKIGAARLLHLIRANGTVFELFSIIECTSVPFARTLVAILDEDCVEELCQKTITAGRSIGMLNWSLKKLRSADGVLLRSFEQKIGAGRLLRLIRANGTLFELFGMARCTSKQFGEELLNLLDKTTAEELCEKTIASSRSIASLPYTLTMLKNRDRDDLVRLEGLIGLERWWRLMVANARPSQVDHFRDAFSEEFCGHFLRASDNLAQDDWDALMARGEFFDACRFLAEMAPQLPASARGLVCQAIESQLPRLKRGSDWVSWNSGRRQLEGVPNSVIGTMLHEALFMHVMASSIDLITGLEYKEAINAVDCLWSTRPEMRPELTRHLWTILPAQARWPQKAGDVVELKPVLDIARSTMVPTSDVDRLLQATRFKHLRTFYDEVDSMPLFDYLWSLAAVSNERRPGTGQKFAADPSHDLCLSVIRGVAPRAHGPLDPEERVAVFALAGLMTFLVPESGPKLKTSLKGPISDGLPWLCAATLRFPFVPAFFALSAMSLLQPDRMHFNTANCKLLLSSSEAGGENGPAIEFLRDQVRRHLKG